MGEATWVCPTGHDNTEQHAFCTLCGAARPVEDGAVAGVCGHGHSMAAGHQFCPECGVPRAKPTAAAPTSHHIPWQYAPFGVLAVAALAVIVVLAIMRSGHLVTGDEVAAHTEDWVTNNYTRSVDRVECPDDELDDGDSVICEIAFTDGGFASIKVTVAGERDDIRYYEELAP